jgi:hypothetical protein
MIQGNCSVCRCQFRRSNLPAVTHKDPAPRLWYDLDPWVGVSGAGTTQDYYDSDGKLVKTLWPNGTATIHLGIVEYDLAIGGAVANTRSYYAVPCPGRCW